MDGKSGTPAGITLPELGELLVSLGAYWAVNLDGGGSTTLVSRDTVISSPSDDGVGCYSGQDFNPRSAADGFWHEKNYITSYTGRYPRLESEGRVWDYFPVSHTCPRAVAPILCLHDDLDQGPQPQRPDQGPVSKVFYVNVALAAVAVVLSVLTVAQLYAYCMVKRAVTSAANIQDGGDSMYARLV